jgi:inner membrane protein
MTGACLARAGFNRKAAYATLAMTVAAELPDLDTLWSIGGPIAAFQHHRGWTHTLLGIPFEAAIVVGAIWLFHQWRYRRPSATTLDGAAVDTHRFRAAGVAPIHWPLLYAFAIVALLSHILLDWTNNYGVRPFFPFNPHWYAGSFVFIFEPLIFGVLLVALIAPSLFGLINSEVGVRRVPYRGRGWAIAALLAIVSIWGWRAYEQQRALQLAATADLNGAEILRIAASPHPITPFRWHIVIESPQFFQLASVDLLTNSLTVSPGDIFYKSPTTLATLIAKRSWLGEAYLDWSQFPLVTDSGHSSDPDPGLAALTTVTFHDLRFMYDVSFLKGREQPPLSGSVSINADHRIVAMEMDGRPQK